MLMTLSCVYLWNQRNQNSQTSGWSQTFSFTQTKLFVFGPQLLRKRSADHMNVAVTYDLDLTFNSHKGSPGATFFLKKNHCYIQKIKSNQLRMMLKADFCQNPHRIQDRAAFHFKRLKTFFCKFIDRKALSRWQPFLVKTQLSDVYLHMNTINKLMPKGAPFENVLLCKCKGDHFQQLCSQASGEREM